MLIRHPDIHPITAQLDRRLRTCCGPRRQHRIMSRWAGDPALGGLTIEEILTICATPTADQNQVVMALVRRHQAGDDDATTVVLVALNAIVVHVVRRRIHLDWLSEAWASVAYLLATIDPDEPLRRADGSEPVAMAVMADRIIRLNRHLNRDDARYRERVRDRQLTVAGPGSRVLEGKAMVCSVEDRALARHELSRIREVLAGDPVTADRWTELVGHRLDPDSPAAPDPVRRRVSRTATRLATLIGHAA